MLPDDVLLLAFDFLQAPQPVAAVCRRFADLWHSHYQPPGAAELHAPLWVRVRVDRSSTWLPPPGSAPRTLFVDVAQWTAERPYLGRLMASLGCSGLTRLVLTSPDRMSVQESAWVAMCAALPPSVRATTDNTTIGGRTPPSACSR